MTSFLTIDYQQIFETAGSVFIVFLFVFKLDFECPCDPMENSQICLIYMSLPAISLCIIVIITEMSTRSVFCNNGTGTKNKCIVFFMSVIKGLSVASLWIITLLIKGDWYVCLKTTNYDLPPNKQIFCKMFKTSAEAAEIRVQKGFSHVIAILVLFALSVVWVFITIRQFHCLQPLVYQYNKFLLEETDLYIIKELQKMAEGTAKTIGQKQIEKVKKNVELSPQPERVVHASFIHAQTSEPQQTATVKHNVPETQQEKDVLLTNVQITAKQTEQQQTEAVLLANIQITADPTKQQQPGAALLANIQIIANQTKQQQPGAVLLTNIQITANPTEQQH